MSTYGTSVVFFCGTPPHNYYNDKSDVCVCVCVSIWYSWVGV